jgi:hypothetical protein
MTPPNGRDAFPGGASGLQIREGPPGGPWWVRLPLSFAISCMRLHDGAPSKLALNPGVPPRLPSVDRLLAHPDAATLVECFGRTATVDALRTALAAARTALQETSRLTPPSEDILIARAEGALTVLRKPSLKVVFNLTGTVLHTNLGRALLNEEAAQAVARVLT